MVVDSTRYPPAPAPASDGDEASVPWQLWAIVTVVIVLRALPFLATLTAQTEPGFMYLPVGYNPSDTLAYASFMHNTTENTFALENSYTTEPQDGRFIIIFMQALGKIHSWTGFSPFYIFEFSRIPLLFIFFGILWNFLRPIFPNTRTRLWVCGLTALSGGFEAIALLLTGTLQPEIAFTMHQHLGPTLGWTTFQGFNNPLWIWGYILILLTLAPLLNPLNTFGPRAIAQSSLCLIVLYFSHPYSAIVVGTVTVSLLVAKLLWSWGPSNPLGWRELRIVFMLFLSGVPCGCVALWQSSDAVFKKSAASSFGIQEIPVFWYPVVYGALFFFALKGWQYWLREAHPWRISLGAWCLAVILLHTSPLLNGYHFVFYLHLPLCIVAAPVVQRVFENLWLRKNVLTQTLLRRTTAVALGGVLCVGTITTTTQSLYRIKQSHIPIEFVAIAQKMNSSETGNVLAPPVLSQLLPVYTHHKVYVGHWFLTPDFDRRRAHYENALQAIYNYKGDSAAETLAELDAILSQHRIRYFIVPTVLKQNALSLFRKRVESFSECGSLTILTFKK